MAKVIVTFSYDYHEHPRWIETLPPGQRSREIRLRSKAAWTWYTPAGRYEVGSDAIRQDCKTDKLSYPLTGGRGQAENQRKEKVPQSRLSNLGARRPVRDVLDTLTQFEEPGI